MLCIIHHYGGRPANPGTVTRIHVACQLGLCCLGLQLDLELNIPKMYQAAEEGEGGRDVGEGASVEARPGSRNSAETPLNPSKLVHPFPLIQNHNKYLDSLVQYGQNIDSFSPGCSTVSLLGTSSLRSLEPSRSPHDKAL